MRLTLTGMLTAAVLALAGSAHAADVPDKIVMAKPIVAATATGWSCSAFSRISHGLLYDTPGFFGTKKWAASTLVGCAQPNGGWDFDVAGNTPFEQFNVANEADADVGYTFVFGKLRVRFGAGYWNFQPAPGPRFQVAEFQVKTSYTLLEANGFMLAAWARVEDQELFTGIAHLQDVNVGGGINFEVPLGNAVKLVGEAGHYHHLKSFGPSRDVSFVTLEMPFNIPGNLTSFLPGAKVTVGPWWRATVGNINGPPGNRESNNSAGGKLGIIFF